MEKAPVHFEVGDLVVLGMKSTMDNPPPGTVGCIVRLYEATGGPAAYLKWDCKNSVAFHNRALLKHLEAYDGSELCESDVSIDILFGDVLT